MIRYSIVLSTSQSAVNHANRGWIPVAQVARKRDGGSPQPTSFGSDALYSDRAQLDRADFNGSNLDPSDLDCTSGTDRREQAGLPMHQIYLPTGLPVAHFNFGDLPLGGSILGQQLGQRLKERPWCPRSGRYKCVTVPKQD